MKILLVHNSYQQPGGEDVVFRAEYDLLAEAGHHVSVYVRSNHEISDYNPLQKASLAPRTVWAWDTLKAMRQIIAGERPDVVHFHNTFPLISPSAYFACREAGVPVVQTLHNPRLLCPTATLHRNGTVCQDCTMTKTFWPAVLHGCYRQSRVETGVVATMLTVHQKLKTWQKLVNCYIASTRFFADKFTEAGLPTDKIHVKPHFVPRGYKASGSIRQYALFVGRLAPEKGVPTLLTAWARIPRIPLKIRGDGPLYPYIRARTIERSLPIELLSRLPQGKLIRLFQSARFLVWPSEGLYETFGMVAIEAFACGVPVIASNAGAMAEIVRDHCTGLHFRSGDPQDLAAKVEWAWNHSGEMEAMGRAARAEYEAKYTPERNREMLLSIYEFAINGKKSTRYEPSFGNPGTRAYAESHSG
ncbi:MAG TPA: glycosyltransferase family 4 protein [Candidatus Acidoferrales bacterium]|nr:glycosyltransferase family 4 protein [Candidatus Acidoferrales bacterium]